MATYDDEENTSTGSEETTEPSGDSSNDDNNDDIGSESSGTETDEGTSNNEDNESGTGTTTDPSSGTGTGESGTGTTTNPSENTSGEGGTGTETNTGDTSGGSSDTPTPTPSPASNETTGDDIVEPPKIPTESDAQEAAKEQEITNTTTTDRVKLPKFSDPTMDRSSIYYKGEESLESLQTNRTVLLNHPLTVEVAGSDNLRRIKQEEPFKVEDLTLNPAIENALSKVEKPDAALKVRVVENKIDSITEELKRLADDADKAIKYWEELQKKPSQELLKNKLNLLQQLYTCGAIEHDVYADELGTVAKELGYSFTINKENSGKKKKNP